MLDHHSACLRRPLTREGIVGFHILWVFGIVIVELGVHAREVILCSREDQQEAGGDVDYPPLDVQDRAKNFVPLITGGWAHHGNRREM